MQILHTRTAQSAGRGDLGGKQAPLGTGISPKHLSAHPSGLDESFRNGVPSLLGRWWRRTKTTVVGGLFIIHIFCVPATGAGNRHRHRQPAGNRRRAPATGAGNRHRRRQPAGHRHHRRRPSVTAASHRHEPPAPVTNRCPPPATVYRTRAPRTGNQQQGSGKCQLALSNRARLPSSDHTFGLSCDKKSKRICTIKTQQRYRKDINRYTKKDR